jgi:Domain of unknown function (DUF4164)
MLHHEPTKAQPEGAMNDMSALHQAIKRLQDALDALDGVIEMRLEDNDSSAIADQVHAFSTDRARLASELDGARARSRELEGATREAARRLDDAMHAIRSLIAANPR